MLKRIFNLRYVKVPPFVFMVFTHMLSTTDVPLLA